MQFQSTQLIVEEFEKEGGDGQRLQAMLIQVCDCLTPVYK